MVEIVNYFDEKIIEKAVKILADGGIVIFPTETVYALAVDAANDEAIRKLHQCKARNSSKPLSLFVADLYQAKSVVEIDERAQKLSSRFFPGPLTIVLNRSENTTISKLVNPQQGTIGIRIPDHSPSIKILKAFGRPLIATSANISGKNEDSKDSQKIIEHFPNVDLIIDLGDTEYKNFSTVVDLSGTDVKILREGVICAEKIFKILGVTPAC